MARDAEFHISMEDKGLQRLLRLRGVLGPDAAAALHREAAQIAAGRGDVGVDWSAAEHVSAASLQVLLALQKSLSGKGRKLEVVADHPAVRRFLETAGLSGRFAGPGIGA